MKKLFIFIVSLILVKVLVAQNQANIWYSGEHCGMDFISGIPDVLNDGQTYSGGGFASISDSSGNLLFYSDNMMVYTKDHQVLVGTSRCKWQGNREMAWSTISLLCFYCFESECYYWILLFVS